MNALNDSLINKHLKQCLFLENRFDNILIFLYFSLFYHYKRNKKRKLIIMTVIYQNSSDMFALHDHFLQLTFCNLNYIITLCIINYELLFSFLVRCLCNWWKKTKEVKAYYWLCIFFYQKSQLLTYDMNS